MIQDSPNANAKHNVLMDHKHAARRVLGELEAAMCQGLMMRRGAACSCPQLFQPIQLGLPALQHRVVLAPLTRFKFDRTSHVPTILLMKEYYTQRASTPGTLLITEATFIAAQAGGYANVPGIWSQQQIDAWNQCTRKDPSSSFSSGPSGAPPSRTRLRLKTPEIDEYVALYDVSNVRDNEYRGGIENRSRFALRVVDAVVDAVGADRTGFRLSPRSSFQDMGMSDPLLQFTHPTSTLAPQRIITANGYDRAAALAAAEEGDVLVAFGRSYISNPDLPKRLKDIPLTPYDRKTFYTPVDKPGAAHGYIDYPFAEEGRL
ncbi:hypothetical protein BD779DRAFT_1469066 [Infundibulicybe gibba]|nr:hypothetical protein BD779DRAFT_1469066 [Infundibulicybe gibba]